jgi:hypothetical protein
VDDQRRGWRPQRPVYNADPDGSNVRSPLGDIPTGTGTQATETTTEPTGTTAAPGGSTTLPGGKTPAEVLECIQQAQGDVEKIQACAR